MKKVNILKNQAFGQHEQVSQDLHSATGALPGLPRVGLGCQMVEGTYRCHYHLAEMFHCMLSLLPRQFSKITYYDLYLYPIIVIFPGIGS
jgi:hypothetical protein